HLRTAAGEIRLAADVLPSALRRDWRAPFDIEGLAKMSEDLDRRAADIEPPSDFPARRRGRPSLREFNCFVLIMKEVFENTGHTATANYNPIEQEYYSLFIDVVELYFSKLRSIPRTWPQHRKGRSRQIKSVLDSARRAKSKIPAFGD